MNERDRDKIHVRRIHVWAFEEELGEWKVSVRAASSHEEALELWLKDAHAHLNEFGDQVIVIDEGVPKLFRLTRVTTYEEAS